MEETKMPEAMEKTVRLTCLLAFYGDLLTDNQREMARLHWEEDLSLAEIAQQFSISRQSVHDTISRTEKQMESFEEKLGLLARFQRLEHGLKACEEELRQIKTVDDTEEHLVCARRIILELLDQEEQ